MAFHGEGHERFGQLALERLLLREVLVFSQLLRDGAAAFHYGSRLDVVDQRSPGGYNVEAGMRVKAMILYCDNGLQVNRSGSLSREVESLLALDSRRHIVEALRLECGSVQVESSCREGMRLQVLLG